MEKQKIGESVFDFFVVMWYRVYICVVELIGRNVEFFYDSVVNI